MLGLFRARPSKPSTEVLQALQTLLKLSLPTNIALSKEEAFFIDKSLSCLPYIDDSRHLYLVFYEFEAPFKAVIDQYLNRNDMFKLSPDDAVSVRNGVPFSIWHMINLIVSSHLHSEQDILIETSPSSATNVTSNESIASHLAKLSEIARHWPSLMNIDSTEKHFLCSLLGNLHSLQSPKSLRDEVVRNCNVEALAMNYGKAHKMRRLKVGEPLELINLAQEITFKHSVKQIA